MLDQVILAISDTLNNDKILVMVVQPVLKLSCLKIFVVCLICVFVTFVCFLVYINVCTMTMSYSYYLYVM